MGAALPFPRPGGFNPKRHNHHTQTHTQGNMESTIEEVIQAATEPPFSEKLKERIRGIRALQSDAYNNYEQSIRWLESNAEAIEKTGMVPTAFGKFVDFDNPTREQVMAIIKAFPGSWDKEHNTRADDLRMNYIRRPTEGEPQLRIWAGELPPSCRVVEETVTIPEQTVTRKKIVCNEAQASAPTPETAEEFAAQIILGSMTSKPA